MGKIEMKKQKIRYIGWLVLTGCLASLMMMIITACDSPDPTGPAASARITLTATDMSIPADGSSTSLITAYIRDPEGFPAEGPVYWSTSCGSLDKSSDTMADGVSSVTFTAPNYPCTAIITADAVHAKATIEIHCYSVDATGITLTANPDNIPADGKANSTISAYVLDDRGLPVVDGTTVDFSTTGGTLSGSSATTDSGRASVTLTSSTVASEVNVYATVGDAVTSVKVWFYSVEVGSVVLNANPQTGIPSDDASYSIITATVKDIHNNSVIDGTVVRFTSTWGHLSTDSTSTVSGVATVYLHSDYDQYRYNDSTVTGVSGNKSGSVVVRFIPYQGTPKTPIPTSSPVPTNSPPPTQQNTNTPTHTPTPTTIPPTITPTPTPSNTPTPTPTDIPFN